MWASVLSILAGAFAIGKLIWRKVFSDEAWRRNRELADAKRDGRNAVEAERLDATYKRIDAEPPKAGDDLLDDLNRKRP